MSTRSTILTGDARQAAAADCREYYDAGNSVRGVAARFGYSFGKAYELLTEAGTVFRARNGKYAKAGH